MSEETSSAMNELSSAIMTVVINVLGVGFLGTPQFNKCQGVIITPFLFAIFGTMAQLSTVQLGAIYDLNHISEWGNLCKLLIGKQASVAVRLLQVLNGILQSSILLSLMANPMVYIFEEYGDNVMNDSWFKTMLKEKIFWILIIWFVGFGFFFKRKMAKSPILSQLGQSIIIMFLLTVFIFAFMQDPAKYQLYHQKSEEDYPMIYPKTDTKSLIEAIPSFFFAFTFQQIQQDIRKNNPAVQNHNQIFGFGLAIACLIQTVTGWVGYWLFKDDIQPLLINSFKGSIQEQLLTSQWYYHVFSLVVQLCQVVIGMISWPFLQFTGRDNLVHMMNSVYHRVRQDKANDEYKKKLLENGNGNGNKLDPKMFSHNIESFNQSLRSADGGMDDIKVSRISEDGKLHIFKIDKSTEPLTWYMLCLFQSFLPVIINFIIPKTEQVMALRGTIISTSICQTLPSLVLVYGYIYQEKKKDFLQQQSVITLCFGITAIFSCLVISQFKLVVWS